MNGISDIFLVAFIVGGVVAIIQVIVFFMLQHRKPTGKQTLPVELATGRLVYRILRSQYTQISQDYGTLTLVENVLEFPTNSLEDWDYGYISGATKKYMEERSINESFNTILAFVIINLFGYNFANMRASYIILTNNNQTVEFEQGLKNGSFDMGIFCNRYNDKEWDTPLPTHISISYPTRWGVYFSAREQAN